MKNEIMYLHTVFALFHFEFKGNLQVQAPEGLY